MTELWEASSVLSPRLAGVFELSLTDEETNRVAVGPVRKKRQPVTELTLG